MADNTPIVWDVIENHIAVAPVKTPVGNTIYEGRIVRLDDDTRLLEIAELEPNPQVLSRESFYSWEEARAAFESFIKEKRSEAERMWPTFEEFSLIWTNLKGADRDTLASYSELSLQSKSTMPANIALWNLGKALMLSKYKHIPVYILERQRDQKYWIFTRKVEIDGDSIDGRDIYRDIYVIQTFTHVSNLTLYRAVCNEQTVWNLEE